MQHIVIPRFVRYIKDAAFSKSGLASVEFEGDMVEYIQAAFGSCENLTSIMLPNSIQRLSGGVFAKCSHLENVIIGSDIQSIGGYAFNECEALQTVTFMTSVPPTEGGNSFSNCNDSLRLIVPCGAREAYEGFYEYVNYVEEDCNRYNISVVGNNGDNQVMTMVSSAMMGEEVACSVSIEPDYILNEIRLYKADDETINIPVTDLKFVMPDFDVVIKAEFVHLPMGEGNLEWYYEIENENVSVTYQHLEYAADTTINHKEVVVIIRTNTLYDKGEHSEVTREYIYEEDNVVYWWNKTLQEFTVLYDLGARQGDNWVIKVGPASLTMHVDAVEQYEYEGRVFKMMQVSDMDDLFSGTIVCGSGHLTSFFPERLMQKGRGYCVDGIRCYWREGELVFKNGDKDCDEVYQEYHNGIEEDGPLTGSATLNVYPNPISGVLFVETQNFASLPTETYRITNLMGQTLMSGNATSENQQIDVSNLPIGMYFITIGGATRKFVAE
ncbi:MAG: leucine-rich repeat domain-containing protein [Bacteroidales bacterium]|nr:leucine-rich repeat domain-containing protein [Bacteroidales bacterium]